MLIFTGNFGLKIDAGLLKTSGNVEMGWMYCAHGKKMNFGGGRR